MLVEGIPAVHRNQDTPLENSPNIQREGEKKKLFVNPQVAFIF